MAGSLYRFECQSGFGHPSYSDWHGLFLLFCCGCVKRIAYGAIEYVSSCMVYFTVRRISHKPCSIPISMPQIWVKSQNQAPIASLNFQVYFIQSHSAAHTSRTLKSFQVVENDPGSNGYFCMVGSSIQRRFPSCVLCSIQLWWHQLCRSIYRWFCLQLSCNMHEQKARHSRYVALWCVFGLAFWTICHTALVQSVFGICIPVVLKVFIPCGNATITKQAGIRRMCSIRNILLANMTPRVSVKLRRRTAMEERTRLRKRWVKCILTSFGHMVSKPSTRSSSPSLRRCSRLHPFFLSTTSSNRQLWCLLPPEIRSLKSILIIERVSDWTCMLIIFVISTIGKIYSVNHTDIILVSSCGIESDAAGTFGMRSSWPDRIDEQGN